MKRKVALLLAVLSSLTVMSCPVAALEPLALPDDGSIVQPRWTNISRIDIDMDRYGNINTYTVMRNDVRYVVIVELKESNGTVVESWQEENGDVVTSYDLDSGVRYYAKVTVKVYNSAGRVIETATANSPTVTAA